MRLQGLDKGVGLESRQHRDLDPEVKAGEAADVHAEDVEHGEDVDGAGLEGLWNGGIKFVKNIKNLKRKVSKKRVKFRCQMISFKTNQKTILFIICAEAKKGKNYPAKKIFCATIIKHKRLSSAKISAKSSSNGLTRGLRQEVEPLRVGELPGVGGEVGVGELHPLGEAGGARGEGEDHNVGGGVHWKGETRTRTDSVFGSLLLQN